MLKTLRAELLQLSSGKNHLCVCVGQGLPGTALYPAFWDLATSFLLCVCVEEPPSGQSGSDLEEETGEGRGKVRSLSDTRVFLFFSENLVGH